MAADTSNAKYVTPLLVGDLQDVSSQGKVEGANLRYNATDAEYKNVPPGAAIINATDATTVITQLNLLLAAARTHGIIAP